MSTRYFALIIGLAFLVAGILGFVPGLVHPPHIDDPMLSIESNYGRLLGIFPVNSVHNIVHLAVGVWGLFAFATYGAARTFSRGLFVFYAILTVLGLIPSLSTMLGLAPIFDNDVWLHGGTAVLAAIFGYAVEPRGSRRTTPTMGPMGSRPV